MRNIVTRTMS